MQTAPSFPSVEHDDSFPGKDAPRASRDLVISIHDVSTVTRCRVEQMLEDLAEVGVGVTSLLVIPDHHHRGAIDRDPDFGTWLRQVTRRGHEAVLHGFNHLRPSLPDESIVTRLITRSYTAGEGELYDSSFEEALKLLRSGKSALRACGVDPSGFIAPAWLLGTEAERAVRAEGFDYTTRIASVIDCRKGRQFASRSLVYSVRAPWRRSVSLLWNEILFQSLQLQRTPLMRLGLHPPDWGHRAVRRHILGLIRRAVQTRRVTTYRDWLDQWRASVHEESHLR